MEGAKKTLLERAAGALELYLPTVMLLAVFVSQQLSTYTRGLVPWKGGGFGMFATVDSAVSRTVKVTVRLPRRAESFTLDLRDREIEKLVHPMSFLTNRKTAGTIANAVFSRGILLPGAEVESISRLVSAVRGEEKSRPEDLQFPLRRARELAGYRERLGLVKLSSSRDPSRIVPSEVRIEVLRHQWNSKDCSFGSQEIPIAFSFARNLK